MATPPYPAPEAATGARTGLDREFPQLDVMLVPGFNRPNMTAPHFDFRAIKRELYRKGVDVRESHNMYAQQPQGVHEYYPQAGGTEPRIQKPQVPYPQAGNAYAALPADLPRHSQAGDYCVDEGVHGPRYLLPPMVAFQGSDEKKYSHREQGGRSHL